MSWFRKKPVVVEARKLTMGNMIETAAWCNARIGVSAIFVPTLEGTMQGNVGDWIVKGVKGEFYPVKPDIFVMTYELSPGPDVSGE